MKQIHVEKYRQLGLKIAYYRKLRGLTQETLAEEIGRTPAFVGHIEAPNMECPERLLFVTKWLYPEVAKKYKTSWEAVERNIRTVSDIVWRENRVMLQALALRKLGRKATVAEFFSILSFVMKLRTTGEASVMSTEYLPDGQTTI